MCMCIYKYIYIYIYIIIYKYIWINVRKILVRFFKYCFQFFSSFYVILSGNFQFKFLLNVEFSVYFISTTCLILSVLTIHPRLNLISEKYFENAICHKCSFCFIFDIFRSSFYLGKVFIMFDVY